MQKQHEAPALGRTCVLGRKIPAIPVISDLFGKPEFGAIASLPAEAVLAVCGRGINAVTARVRWNEGYYIVFPQDLGLSSKAPNAH